MAHSIVQEAEAILDKEFKVLDRGFIRLVDYLGSDERIVQAARVSYARGTKSYREDKALIDYLLRNDHTSPFEQVVFTFHVKMPIFVARQWLRHRTARVNEISGRYSVFEPEFYIPQSEDIALQSTDNKQGRSKEAVTPELKEKVLSDLRNQQKDAYAVYKDLIGKGIARELARVVLPLSLYTEIFWQIDLHNLFHFIRLRMDAHAQKEIRVYAEILLSLAKRVCPLACESFENHIRLGKQFSAKELDALRKAVDVSKTGLEGKELGRLLEKLSGTAD